MINSKHFLIVPKLPSQAAMETTVKLWYSVAPKNNRTEYTLLSAFFLYFLFGWLGPCRHGSFERKFSETSTNFHGWPDFQLSSLNLTHVNA